MEDYGLLGSLDTSGELRELVKARKWAAVVDLCEKGITRGDARDALRVSRSAAQNETNLCRFSKLLHSF